MNIEEVTITMKEYRALLASVYAAENYLCCRNSFRPERLGTLNEKVREYYKLKANADIQSI